VTGEDVPVLVTGVSEDGAVGAGAEVSSCPASLVGAEDEAGAATLDEAGAGAVPGAAGPAPPP